MRIAISLLLSLGMGSGLYTIAAIAWSLLDPQGAGRTLLFTIPIGIVATTGLGLLAAAMMLPFGPPAKKRPADKAATRRAAPPPAPAAEAHPDEVDLALSA